MKISKSSSIGTPRIRVGSRIHPPGKADEILSGMGKEAPAPKLAQLYEKLSAEQQASMFCRRVRYRGGVGVLYGQKHVPLQTWQPKGGSSKNQIWGSMSTWRATPLKTGYRSRNLLGMGCWASIFVVRLIRGSYSLSFWHLFGGFLHFTRVGSGRATMIALPG